MFKQQIIGVINISLPIIIFFNLCPTFFSTLASQIFCAALTGTYIYYLNRKATKNLISSLKYKPTGQHNDMFTSTIKTCGMNPEHIQLNYAYTNESIAINALNTIIIDPIMWNINQDPEALKVIDIFNAHIAPNVAPTQKIRLEKITSALSKEAQSFIFKHELGHVFDNYSNKKLCLIWINATLAAYSGIWAALKILPYSGIYAVFTGMLVGGLIDLLIHFTSNITFKLYAEKKADMFALRYSCKAEISAAADFFEEHQAILDIHKEPGNIMSHLPSIITSGHLNGRSRALFLRRYIASNI